jgi:hypothetical protein
VTPQERQALLPLLDDLVAAVEDVVATGLTVVSKSTLDRLDSALKEASRLKLGRFAAALRFANEEIARYLAQSPDFDARRLSLFLNRAWILGVGLARALRAQDEAAIGRLLWLPPSPRVVPSVRVVTLGVNKTVKRSVGSFEFRMRDVDSGERLLWSFLVNRQNLAVPLEAWLHLPQPQKFDPKVLLTGNVVTMEQVAISADGRLMLGPKAKVTEGEAYTDTERFLTWDRSAALSRVRAHTPSPLDLEVELQEEVVLRDWTVGAPVDRGRPGYKTFPIEAEGLSFDASVSTTDEGAELTKALTSLRKGKARPPLFGLVHYESCRLVLRPLSVQDGGQMRHLMVSGDNIDKKKLLAALNLKS